MMILKRRRTRRVSLFNIANHLRDDDYNADDDNTKDEDDKTHIHYHLINCHIYFIKEISLKLAVIFGSWYTEIEIVFDEWSVLLMQLPIMFIWSNLICIQIPPLSNWPWSLNFGELQWRKVRVRFANAANNRKMTERRQSNKHDNLVKIRNSTKTNWTHHPWNWSLLQLCPYFDQFVL